MAEVQKKNDDGYAPERWAFDAKVTAAFDDMLARSIPQHDLMRRAAFDLGCRHVQPQTAILDLGCSRGEALAPFVEKFGAYNRYVGIDVSEPMLEASRQRFAAYLPTGIVSVRRCDLRTDYPPERASLTLCVLSLQFTPIEYRQQILRNVWRHTVAGGACVLIEKVLGAAAELDRTFVDAYYALKEQNGYSRDDIDRKRFSLEGVLVPVTARWNEDLLRGAGFAQVDCFWRWMNFAGWIAVKE